MNYLMIGLLATLIVYVVQVVLIAWMIYPSKHKHLHGVLVTAWELNRCAFTGTKRNKIKPVGTMVWVLQVLLGYALAKTRQRNLAEFVHITERMVFLVLIPMLAKSEDGLNNAIDFCIEDMQHRYRAQNPSEFILNLQVLESRYHVSVAQTIAALTVMLEHCKELSSEDLALKTEYVRVRDEAYLRGELKTFN